MTDLSISIVTIDRALVLDCLKSIYETVKSVTFEIHVVVNHLPAANDIESAIRADFPMVKLIINREETGFTHNHNKVIRECSGRYILILNDDTVMLGGALDRMVRYMDDHPQVGVLGCTIRNPDGSLQWSCGKSFNNTFEHFRSGVLRTLLSPLVRDQFYKETQEVTWVTGACLLARSEAIGRVGLFDENISMYFEDGDWCYRMILAGWKVVYYTEAEIIHYRSQTSKKHPAKTVIFYYESRLYFFFKHYGSCILQIIRLLTLADIMLLWLRETVSPSRPSRQEMKCAYRHVIKMLRLYDAGRFKRSVPKPCLPSALQQPRENRGDSPGGTV